MGPDDGSPRENVAAHARAHAFVGCKGTFHRSHIRTCSNIFREDRPQRIQMR